MSAREHLAQVLEGTGLYELTGSSPVDWELAAYGAGFALLEERFDQLLGDLFPATASREKLAQWEELFRPQRARASLEDCRETVQCRLAIQRDGFTPPDVQALLPGAGVRGLLLEGESGLTVVLGRLLGVTQAEAQRELDQLLPAHLAWAWEESITWVAWDAYSHPFEEWDGLGLTWAQLDQMVREDLEDYFEEET